MTDGRTGHRFVRVRLAACYLQRARSLFLGSACEPRDAAPPGRERTPLARVLPHAAGGVHRVPDAQQRAQQHLDDHERAMGGRSKGYGGCALNVTCRRCSYSRFGYVGMLCNSQGTLLITRTSICTMRLMPAIQGFSCRLGTQEERTSRGRLRSTLSTPWCFATSCQPGHAWLRAFGDGCLPFCWVSRHVYLSV